MVSFLVLGFNRERELDICLRSIKDYAMFEYQTIVLSNGGDHIPAIKYQQAGLIDKLILNSKNSGGGYGTTELFRVCPTQFGIYVQEDQYLGRPMTENDIRQMTKYILEGGLPSKHPRCEVIGLAGNQCQGKYSERAQLVNVPWYNEVMKNAPNGGPGPFHDRMHNEEFMQRHFASQGLEFVIAEPFFNDNGKRSYRDYPCGGRTLHYTDSKKLFIINAPKRKYSFPNLTESEWQLVFDGKWVDGTIPENDRPHSFNYWPE